MGLIHDTTAQFSTIIYLEFNVKLHLLENPFIGFVPNKWNLTVCHLTFRQIFYRIGTKVNKN